MSDWLAAIILGLVEGLTEFIPVSSTGHMLLLGHFMGFQSSGKTFEIVIQLGALLAIVSVYFKRLWTLATRITWDDTPDVAASYLAQLTRAGAVEAELGRQIEARIAVWRGGRADKRASSELAGTLNEAAGKSVGLNATRLRSLAAMFERRGR